MLKNSGTLRIAAVQLGFIAGLVARAAESRLSSDTIVSTIKGNEVKEGEKLSSVKIGIAGSNSLPDYTHKGFISLVNEMIEKNPRQAVSFNETTGTLTFDASKLPAGGEKKTSVAAPAEPATKVKKGKAAESAE
jgi:hypothetical protein